MKQRKKKSDIFFENRLSNFKSPESFPLRTMQIQAGFSFWCSGRSRMIEMLSVM